MKPCSECGTPTDRAYVYDPDIQPIPVCESEECRLYHALRVSNPGAYRMLKRRKK